VNVDKPILVVSESCKKCQRC